jgi:hypothetical protein
MKMVATAAVAERLHRKGAASSNASADRRIRGARGSAPRGTHGKSSRQGGHRHDQERSLSPATRRSRDRSLDRFIYCILRQEPPRKEEGIDYNKRQGPWGQCRSALPSPKGRPNSGSAGTISTTPANHEVDFSDLFRFPETATHLDPFDPMLPPPSELA